MIYIIGESLGALTEGQADHRTSSARLAALMGVGEVELLSRVVWLNLFDSPATNLTLIVEAIERAAQPGDAILLLGRSVANAWFLGSLGPLETIERDDGPVIVAVPHPSGRNRWWNDPENAARGARVLSNIWMRYS